MYEVAIPRNLTPPKGFEFVKRQLEKYGKYVLSFLDDKENVRGYHWFLRHKIVIRDLTPLGVLEVEEL